MSLGFLLPKIFKLFDFPIVFFVSLRLILSHKRAVHTKLDIYVSKFERISNQKAYNDRDITMTNRKETKKIINGLQNITQKT
jgi:hypothetical protein